MDVTIDPISESVTPNEIKGTPQEVNHYKFPIILLVIITVLFAIIFFAVGVIRYLTPPNIENITNNPVGPDIVKNKVSGNPSEVSFVKLVGNQVIDDHGIVFNNVTGVEKVRLGPDKKSFHFKVNIGEKWPTRCITTGPNWHYAVATPSSTRPWDYKNLGPGIPHNCTDVNSSGYLINSNYFVYLKAKFPDDGRLIIEDLLQEKVVNLPVDRVDLKGFFDGIHSAPLGRAASYWTDGIKGDDGYTYFYPQNDAELINGKLIVAVGRLVLAADILKEKLILALPLVEPDYNIISTAFWFLGEKGSPVVVVEAGWEGWQGLQALVDLSGSAAKVINLRNLSKGGLNFFDTKLASWQDGKVVLTLFNTVEIAEQEAGVNKDKINSLNEANDESGIKAEEIIAKTRLMKSNKYKDVWCNLSFGMYSGCWGMINYTQYQYVPGGSLEKI